MSSHLVSRELDVRLSRSGKDHLWECEASLHPFHQETRWRRTECFCHPMDLCWFISLHGGMLFSKRNQQQPDFFGGKSTFLYISQHKKITTRLYLWLSPAKDQWLWRHDSKAPMYKIGAAVPADINGDVNIKIPYKFLWMLFKWFFITW